MVSDAWQREWEEKGRETNNKIARHSQTQKDVVLTSREPENERNATDVMSVPNITRRHNVKAHYIHPTRQLHVFIHSTYLVKQPLCLSRSTIATPMKPSTFNIRFGFCIKIVNVSIYSKFQQYNVIYSNTSLLRSSNY